MLKNLSLKTLVGEAQEKPLPCANIRIWTIQFYIWLQEDEPIFGQIQIPNEYTVHNNNNNTQDDIYSAVYMAPAICESSLWIIWTTVGQRQVSAYS